MMRPSQFSRSYLTSRATMLLEEECIIKRPVEGRVMYDPATRRTINVTRMDIYQGPCRLWELSSGSHIVIGAEEFTTSVLRLTVPWDVDPVPEVDDVFQMTKSTDSSIVGRWLEIIHVTRGGGLRGSRTFTVRYQDKIEP